MFVKNGKLRDKSVEGFTLLEVLVALLIFSLGLLGLAGLLIVSVKTNHSAYLRTQASFLAESMADRMRSNVAGLWAGDYTGSFPEAGAPAPCNVGSPCSIAEIAERDRLLWSRQLEDLLPNPEAEIACVRNSASAVDAAAQLNRVPYDGLCTFTMRWSEASLDTGTDVNQQVFSWVFQP